MRWRNTQTDYGWPSIILHWLIALAVIGMFGFGLWMTGLDYYHPWYHEAPELHKAIGILLFGVVGLRLVWRLLNPTPRPEPGLRRWEVVASGLVHWLLYLLLFATMIFGYLMSTAAGDPVSVFGLFEVPPSYTGLPDQEETAGLIHEWLAWTIIILAGLHALAALKHHFLDRNRTLRRMLGMR